MYGKEGAQMAGASLEMTGHHSKYESALLELCKKSLLQDPVYVERLKRHYAMFKEALKTGRVPKSETGMADLTNQNLADALFGAYVREQGKEAPAGGGEAQVFSEEELEEALSSQLVAWHNPTQQDEGGQRNPASGTWARRIGRNDPCPCGSGKKYKKCCMGK